MDNFQSARKVFIDSLSLALSESKAALPVFCDSHKISERVAHMSRAWELVKKVQSITGHLGLHEDALKLLNEGIDESFVNLIRANAVQKKEVAEKAIEDITQILNWTIECFNSSDTPYPEVAITINTSEETGMNFSLEEPDSASKSNVSSDIYDHITQAFTRMGSINVLLRQERGFFVKQYLEQMIEPDKKIFSDEIENSIRNTAKKVYLDIVKDLKLFLIKAEHDLAAEILNEQAKHQFEKGTP